MAFISAATCEVMARYQIQAELLHGEAGVPVNVELVQAGVLEEI